MNASKFFYIFALGLALLLGAVRTQGAAQARHMDPTITFTYIKTATIDPGVEWRDRDGLHIRGRVDLGTLTGDIRGVARVVYNADLAAFPSRPLQDLEKPFSEGAAYGTIDVFSDQRDLVRALWSGSWTHKVHEGRVVGGAMTAYSLDGLWELQVSSIIQADPRSLVHTGVIEPITLCPEGDCEPDPTFAGH